MKSHNLNRIKFAGRVWGITWVILFVLCIRSFWIQRQEEQVIKETATRIVQQANAQTPQEKATALRDYIRSHVTWKTAIKERQSFLRETACEVLRSGKGYCGENTRLFICMATSLGLPSQRVNFYGKQPHVVAEVQFQPGKAVIVDCQNPPTVAGFTPLDAIIARDSYGYTDYSTLHLERFGLKRLFQRIQLRIGPLSWWLENPHLIMASVYVALLVLLTLGGVLLWRVSRTTQRVVERQLDIKAPSDLASTGSTANINPTT